MANKDTLKTACEILVLEPENISDIKYRDMRLDTLRIIVYMCSEFYDRELEDIMNEKWSEEKMVKLFTVIIEIYTENPDVNPRLAKAFLYKFDIQFEMNTTSMILSGIEEIQTYFTANFQNCLRNQFKVNIHSPDGVVAMMPNYQNVHKNQILNEEILGLCCFTNLKFRELKSINCIYSMSKTGASWRAFANSVEGYDGAMLLLITHKYK